MSHDKQPTADAILEIAKQLRNLGNGSATSDNGHGAIEMHGMKTVEALEKIASSLDGVANAILALAQEVGTLSTTK